MTAKHTTAEATIRDVLNGASLPTSDTIARALAALDSLVAAVTELQQECDRQRKRGDTATQHAADLERRAEQAERARDTWAEKAELAEAAHSSLTATYKIVARRADDEEARADTLTRRCERLVALAEQLWGMVPRQVWLDGGGDDGQGHYEGDYHAEQVRNEIADHRAVLAAGDGTTPTGADE